MGYEASGDCTCRLKKNINIDKLEEILQKVEEDREWFTYSIGKDTLEYGEYESHWHDDETDELLNSLIPFIISGSAYYRGEFGDKWKYDYDSTKGKWIQYDGQVFYSDNEIIEYLKAQGYKISK